MPFLAIFCTITFNIIAWLVCCVSLKYIFYFGFSPALHTRSDFNSQDMFCLPTFSKSVRRFLASQIKQHQSAAFLPRTQKCRSGIKSKPTFSTQEMNRRLIGLRKHMEEERVDACVFTSHHNISYYGIRNFLYVAFGRPYGYIVTMDKTISVSPGELF